MLFPELAAEDSEVAFWRAIVRTNVPKQAQLDAEELTEAHRSQAFTPVENRIFSFMRESPNERQRYCMGLNTNRKTDWKRFHMRWMEICKIVQIRSRAEDDFPVDNVRVFLRSDCVLKQKSKDENRKAKGANL